VRWPTPVCAGDGYAISLASKIPIETASRFTDIVAQFLADPSQENIRKLFWIREVGDDDDFTSPAAVGLLLQQDRLQAMFADGFWRKGHNNPDRIYGLGIARSPGH
jgi:hypothetical protein